MSHHRGYTLSHRSHLPASSSSPVCQPISYAQKTHLFQTVSFKFWMLSQIFSQKKNYTCHSFCRLEDVKQQYHCTIWFRQVVYECIPTQQICHSTRYYNGFSTSIELVTIFVVLWIYIYTFTGLITQWRWDREDKKINPIAFTHSPTLRSNEYLEKNNNPPTW